ncbi:hypothetical protein [Paraburkholderia sp. J41]|uniref:hypothetical protein n=1 Tax=Paraburkholderia sp. J41 TaxID=2805433 RepID=UPI002AC371EE|nr:hypothetical protein [Paraburkholderia sp. J41]
MPRRPPLTARRLAEIWDERQPDPVVLDLLWEIHRLRATIRRAHQIRTYIRHNYSGVPLTVWECFNRELDAEPCLTDESTPRQQAKVEKSPWNRPRETRKKRGRDE